MHYLGESKIHPAVQSNGTFQPADFWKFLRRYKIIFGISALIVISVFGYFAAGVRVYHSELQLYLGTSGFPDHLPESADSRAQYPAAAQNYGQLYRIIYSKEMFDYLISRFDLYTHYGLKKTPGSYLAVRRMLRGNVSLKEGPAKVYVLLVSDAADNRFPADMANEIGRKANEINRKLFIENMHQRVSLYNGLYDEVKSKMSADTRDLAASVDSLGKLLARFSKAMNAPPNNAYAGLTEMQNGFERLSLRIENNLQTYLETSQVYSMALKTIEEDKIPSIAILMDALPDDGGEFMPLWLVACGIVLAALCLNVILFFSCFQFSSYLRSLN